MEKPTALAAYLATSNRSVAAFALAVGAHRSQIHRIAAGDRGAGGALALAIERETAGKVKASEVVASRRGPSRRRHARKVPHRAA